MNLYRCRWRGLAWNWPMPPSSSISTIPQPQARALHQRHLKAAGLRWWSSYEALSTDTKTVAEAAEFLGLRAVR